MTRSPGRPANFALRTIIPMHPRTFDQQRNRKKFSLLPLWLLPLWLLLTYITCISPNHTISLRPVTVHPTLVNGLIFQVLTPLKSLRTQLSFHVLAPGSKNSIMVFEALMAIILRNMLLPSMTTSSPASSSLKTLRSLFLECQLELQPLL